MDWIPQNDLEYLMNEDCSDYRFFNSRQEAVDFLISVIQEPVLEEDLLDSFYVFDTEKDFENPEIFNYSI